MSHEIELFDFEENVNKNIIAKKCSDWCFNKCDLQETGGNNPFCGTEYFKTILDCYEDAKDFLYRRNGGNECIAVRYKHTENFKPSSKLKKLEERKTTLEKRVSELSVSWKADEMKSQTIACKNCGSKLATAYMKGKCHCPLCKNDLRPQTLKDRIEKANNDLKEVSAEFRKLEKAEIIRHNNKTSSLRWLVLCDVHC